MTPLNACKRHQPLENVLHLHSSGHNVPQVLPSLLAHPPGFFFLQKLRKTCDCTQRGTYIMGHCMKKGLQVFVAHFELLRKLARAQEHCHPSLEFYFFDRGPDQLIDGVPEVAREQLCFTLGGDEYHW